MSGYQYPELLGKIHFWLFFIGVNILFFPQHFLGMAGMPRRIPDYPDSYAGWNFVSSLGSLVTGLATLLFFYIMWRTFSSKKKTKPNPWGVGATTLEWTVASPAPFHTHEELPKIGKPIPAE